MNRAVLVFAKSKKIASASSLAIWCNDSVILESSVCDSEIEISNAVLKLSADITLTDFAQLIVDARVAFTFVGPTTDGILGLLNAWRNSLIFKMNPRSHLDHICKTLPWKFEYLGEQKQIAFFQMTNWMSNQTVYFSVIVNRAGGYQPKTAVSTSRQKLVLPADP